MILDTTWRVRDADGTLVLDLNSPGYSVVSSSEDDETWSRELSTSPWVDGDAEVMATRDATVRSLIVTVTGSSWAQIESRRATLRAATTEREWLLEQATEGVSTVWAAGRADSSSAFTSMDLANLRRLVSLRIPVQPSPTITGLEP